MVAQYSLVRLRSKPYMENMIAGKQTAAGVPVYVYNESDKNYHLKEVVPEEQLKVVGALSGKLPTLVQK